jgi:hypothetical protein
MSIARHHAEWLSLVEQSGPFLSVPVLMETFPQGLDARDAAAAQQLREAYESWQAAASGPAALSAHRQWFLHVLTDFLGWPADFILEGQTLPPGLEAPQPVHGETLRPDFALRHRDAGQPPVMLIHLHPPAVKLESALPGHLWKASPATRMAELLRATRVPLGLVTNGEQWMLVHVKDKEPSGFASWFADLWLQEGITLRAFRSLITVSRFFGVAADKTLAALLDASRKDQQEVTDQLGLQVRQAVEVLIQALDRLDAASERQLLTGVPERALYESALTVMMRLVFLFAAEERGLLLLGDRFYDDHYAVSTLCDQLRAYADLHGEEILERRSDAWCRLLATFRAVHGGVEHEAMRLPAYGGTLFDPDRFPFLEGRPAGTRWRDVPAQPLAVNNRVVLHLLEALQVLRVKVPGGGPAEARRLSFRALDIEQIGHVYEGLLDHTARRATGVILGLQGAKGRDPAIPLHELETLAEKSGTALLDFLEEKTGRSSATLANALTGEKPRRGKGKAGVPPPVAGIQPDISAILPACGHDPALAARIAPFAALLRADSFGHPVIILTGSLYTGPGSDRRSTGTHYTPRTLTEPIVQHTLDPLVYRGPADGWPQEKWELKAPSEILALKVCDMAMGSGAFLVQACRYLAEKLVEAWERLETTHPGEFITTPEGSLSHGDPRERLLPADAEERLAIARRCIADRCLYGVDINPMAVEMAKLSLWLITVQKDRPFNFLDHALKPGDSLLGISHVRQLERFSLREADDAQPLLDTANLWRHIKEATDLRRQLESLPSDLPSQLQQKESLHRQAETALAKLRATADFLIAAELDCPGDRGWDTRRALAANHAMAGWNKDLPDFQRLAREALRGRRPFHWPLEFPEVFGTEEGEAPEGFDAFVGNPPFMGGKKITGELGTDYRDFLVANVARGRSGVADFCAYFFLRVHTMLDSTYGMAGLVGTNTIAQGDTREVGLEQIASAGSHIPRAVPSRPWPGVAALEVAYVWLRRGSWSGEWSLDDRSVDGITPFLTEPGRAGGKPFRLTANAGKSFIGSIVLGMGFVLTLEQAQSLIARDERNRAVLFPYLNGEDLNSRPDQSPSRWVINFHDWPLDRSAQGSWRDSSEKQREAWLRTGRVPSDYNGEVASDFPDCLEVVEKLAKPERDQNKRAAYRDRWWLFAERQAALYAATRDNRRVLVTAIITKHLAPSFVLKRAVYAHKCCGFVPDSGGFFATLQSTLHEIWTREFSSTLETRLNYSPTDCCETFPFPTDLSTLESIGERYHEHRRQLMQARGEGLTKTYNRLHNPGETAADIAELRALHRQLDTAVAAAYGWTDLAANDGTALGHGFHETKQGLRYTLSPTARREVLDRLLALNHQRHAEEVAAGLHEKKGKPKKTPAGAKGGRKKRPPPQADGRPLPDDWRFAHDTPALYAVNLVTTLLSSRVEGLPWPKLRDAFAAATTPSLLVRLALPEDKAMSEAWAARWNEAASPEFLIPALRHIGSSNIDVQGEGLSAVFALKDGPKPPATDDVGYDAWIALRVIGELELPVLEDSVEQTLNAGIEEFLLTL